jgi:hypothetical protein
MRGGGNLLSSTGDQMGHERSELGTRLDAVEEGATIGHVLWGRGW